MKKIHWGYITVAVITLIIAITALSAAGYNAEKDILVLSQRPLIEVGRQIDGQVAGVAVEQARITVARANGNFVSLDVEVMKDTTAYDALMQLTEIYGLELQIKEYDFGILVEGIGDLIGGQDDKYWSFYLNGEFALMSADTQQIVAGDLIEFKYQANPFE